MDDNKELNEKLLGKIDLLNNQMAELIAIERKVSSGYDYINAIELAELLGESIKTIYGRVHHKQIPYYKPGGKLLLFKMQEIKQWIEDGRHSTLNEIKERI